MIGRYMNEATALPDETLTSLAHVFISAAESIADIANPADRSSKLLASIIQGLVREDQQIGVVNESGIIHLASNLHDHQGQYYMLVPATTSQRSIKVYCISFQRGLFSLQAVMLIRRRRQKVTDILVANVRDKVRINLSGSQQQSYSDYHFQENNAVEGLISAGEIIIRQLNPAPTVPTQVQRIIDAFSKCLSEHQSRIDRLVLSLNAVYIYGWEAALLDWDPNEPITQITILKASAPKPCLIVAIFGRLSSNFSLTFAFGEYYSDDYGSFVICTSTSDEIGISFSRRAKTIASKCDTGDVESDLSCHMQTFLDYILTIIEPTNPAKDSP